MTPQRLKQLAANPNNIPGVYNYCDRWCERCPLTARCLTYAMEIDQLEDHFDADPAQVSRDTDNRKFWDALSGSLKLTMEMIADDCRERGLDFDQIREEANSPEVVEQERASERRSREHPL